MGALSSLIGGGESGDELWEEIPGFGARGGLARGQQSFAGGEEEEREVLEEEGGRSREEECGEEVRPAGGLTASSPASRFFLPGLKPLLAWGLGEGLAEFKWLLVPFSVDDETDSFILGTTSLEEEVFGVNGLLLGDETLAGVSLS